jgi:hypothetical protein
MLGYHSDGICERSVMSRWQDEGPLQCPLIHLRNAQDGYTRDARELAHELAYRVRENDFEPEDRELFAGMLDRIGDGADSNVVFYLKPPHRPRGTNGDRDLQILRACNDRIHKGEKAEAVYRSVALTFSNNATGRKITAKTVKNIYLSWPRYMREEYA